MQRLFRADPFETANEEAMSYMRWHADNMWLLVPIAEKINKFVATFKDYPSQASSSLNPANININEMIRQQQQFRAYR